MEKIILGRGAGKTFKLIELSAKTGAYIICRDKKEASRIHVQSVEMGVRIPLPITYREFLELEYYGIGIKGFAIDNVEDFLQSLTMVQIEAITLTP